MKLDLFGRLVEVVEGEAGWRVFYLGEGKRRPAHDLEIPPETSADEMVAYFADLCHEWATPEHPEVRRL